MIALMKMPKSCKTSPIFSERPRTLNPRLPELALLKGILKTNCSRPWDIADKDVADDNVNCDELSTDKEVLDTFAIGWIRK